MNALIGKDGNNKFCLHNLPKRNGEYLADFSLKNRLAYLNTKFPKGKDKLWAYTYPNNAKASLDYIFMNKKWINILNCEAYPSLVNTGIRNKQLKLHDMTGPHLPIVI